MSEEPISITTLNDFIFCPASIYFHALDADTDNLMMQESSQLNGSAAHKRVDTAGYSTHRNVLQGISVYSEQYNLVGKIDTFDVKTGILTERKKRIKVIYDGYIFQLYAQYFCLKEMGYTVNQIRFYSMDDNKVHKVDLPEESPEYYGKFLQVLDDINAFQFDSFRQETVQKCMRCIYEPLCSYSAQRGEQINDNGA